MNIPSTLDEAIQELDKLQINPSEISGMGIRNGWKLWSRSDLANWFYCNKIYHPDDMSGIIIESYSRHLKNIDIDLESQIKYYHDFWKNSYSDNHLEIMMKQASDGIAQSRDSKIQKIVK